MWIKYIQRSTTIQRTITTSLASSDSIYKTPKLSRQVETITATIGLHMNS